MIAVLGPSGAQDGARQAAPAELLGGELARHGYGVLVAGDGAVARAAAQGARAVAGGLVHVVTWVGADEVAGGGGAVEREGDALRALARGLELADALIILPGGLQTASVLLQMWLWAMTPSAPYRQTILVGDGWPAMVASLAELLKVDTRTRAAVTFARDPREAVEALRYYVSAQKPTT
ncbi:MAG: LOG family protein [Deltaproteobacteria bacterium]|nr:LOG family protein [Deltaproteobacteria bacterium]